MSVAIALYLLVGLVAAAALVLWAAAGEIRAHGWRDAGRSFRRDLVASSRGLRTQWLALALTIVVAVPLIVVLSPGRDIAGLVVLGAMWLASAALSWKLRRPRPITHSTHVVELDDAERPYVATCEGCGWIGRRRSVRDEAALDARRHG